jgi:catechol 2,3-dioxygenase-like lactoylglutathione lyase family enzyme
VVNWYYLKGVFAMDQSSKLEGTKMAGFDPMPAVTELQIIDIKPGDGEAVPEGATITAHYTGALVKDGTIFQSSKDFGNAISFGLNQVIEGWTKVFNEGIRPSSPNALGLGHIAFEVDDLDGIVKTLLAKGHNLVGSAQNYENVWKLCYVRGPEGIIVELAEKLS